MTIPAGTTVLFGSPAWAEVNTWQVRWRYASGGAAQFFLHYGANGAIDVYIGGTALYLTQIIAGTAYNVATASYTLTAGAWYWVRFTQFPAAPGTQADIYAQVIADNAGAPTGAVIATAGPVATQDGVTALSGQPAIKAYTTDLVIGGGYADTHTLSLFGPGGWVFSGQRGTATGIALGVWERDSTQTWDGGAAASTGAARIDLPPAGTVDACWQLTRGGAQVTAGVPVRTEGDSFGFSAQARSAGLGAGAALSLLVTEYDASGTSLRSGTVASLAGNVSAWSALAGTWTTGAGCAWLDVALRVVDASGGGAGGTVWFDSAQCWNISATGQSAMPYCELRFPQSPAQLLVTGLEGDLPAPTFLAFGTWLQSWPTGSTLSYAIGRRARATHNAGLAAPSIGYFGTALSPQSFAYLDASSYGGYYVRASVTSSGWNPRAFSFTPADAPGVYHLFGRFLTEQAQGNLGNVRARAVTQQRLQPWYGATDGSDVVGTYYGPLSAPVTASGAWTVEDAGQVDVPPFAQGALTDPAKTYLTPRTQWSDLTSGGSQCRQGWQMLLPVDDALLVGTAQNAANALYGVSNGWFWCYSDGLGERAAWTFSVEGTPLPAPARGGGGPGTQSTGTISLNPAADARLTLDPGQQSSGIAFNQFAAYITDDAATVLPLYAEIVYAPLYLYPR
jgi:hypothetical protein